MDGINKEEHINAETTDEIEVRIVNVEPMRIASVRVVSKNPEQQAWQKLSTWAEAEGLLDDLEKHPVFGFNNPSPSPGHKEYGYEFWIGVDSDTDAEGEIEIKDFPGGLYAVTSCTSPAVVGPTWIRLWNHVNSDKCEYKWRKTHELERLLNPRASEDDYEFDLYLPIE